MHASNVSIHNEMAAKRVLQHGCITLIVATFLGGKGTRAGLHREKHVHAWPVLFRPRVPLAYFRSVCRRTKKIQSESCTCRVFG